MQQQDDRRLLWLPLICCGGPILVFAAIGLAPALIAFLLTYKVWVLAAGVGLALAGILVWLRRARRVAWINPASRGRPVVSASAIKNSARGGVGPHDV